MIPMFYDLETQRSPREVEITKLGISCGVVRVNKQNYLYRDSNEDVAALIAMVSKAELLVSYNGIHFDNNVLRGYQPKLELTKTVPQYDILVEIKKIIGTRVRLDHVLKCNFGDSGTKTASGLQALAWYAQIRDYREKAKAHPAKAEQWRIQEEDVWGKLLEYCTQDTVMLAKLLGRIKHGVPIKLEKYWDKSYKMIEIVLPNPFTEAPWVA